MRRLLHLLRGERGLVLPMALGTMVVLVIAVSSAVYYTTQNERSTHYSKGKQVARALAEAGINDTMSVLSLTTNNALKQATLPACSGAQSTWNRSNLDGGYVLWCGDLDISNSLWNITSIGFVRNPANASVIQYKIRARTIINPIITDTLNNPSWDYMFATRTGNVCDETLANNVAGASRMYVMGNLCLNQNVQLSPTSLVVKGNLVLQNGANVGAPTSMSTRVESYVGAACTYGTGSGSTHSPCSGDQDTLHVYSKMNGPSWVAGVNGTPIQIDPPAADFAGWYTNAIPGPTQPCTTASAAPNSPPSFDVLTNGSYVRDNNNPLQDLTPSYSYTCRVGPSSNPDGELSWDASTKTLTIRGTMFMDGSAKIANSALNRYVGQGVLYLSGTFSLSGKLCAVVSGSTCDFASWDPNTALFEIVAGGVGPDNNVPAGDSVYLSNNSVMEGGFYGVGALDFGNNANVGGPMLGSQIILSNNVTTASWPVVTVPAGMPGSPTVYAQPTPPQYFSG